jgi:L-cysteine desulfidase
MEDKIKQVIVVRKDLKMSIGKTSSQVSHASMKFLTDSLKPVMNYSGCGNPDCCGFSPTVSQRRNFLAFVI